MKEVQWLDCTRLDKMMNVLRGKVSDRKLRLFACACCRSIWHLLPEPEGRSAVEVAERFAEGLASQEELADARQAAVALGPVEPFVAPPLRILAVLLCDTEQNLWSAALRTGSAASRAVREAAGATDALRGTAAITSERKKQVALLREIMGNPCRVMSIPKSWPRTVVQLAQAMYVGEDCAFALHDALVEAGRLEFAVHFKTGEHPKGCWVLDLILGKK